MALLLLSKIINCSNFLKLGKQAIYNHPCNKIVGFQKQFSTYQIPEPWSGDLINAPILFISSNPSYSSFELFPDISWPQEMIADFFINRFVDRGIKYSWVYKNKVLNIDGTRGLSVKFWSSINKRAEELLERPPVPGIDYCITEIVKCKSHKEIGVKEAISECSKKYLNEKILVSKAKIIIAVGSLAKEYFKEIKFEKTPIIYIPHPNSRIPKTINKTQEPDIVHDLKKLLKDFSPDQKEVPIGDIGLPNMNEVKKFIDDRVLGYEK